ncbi:MAG TPA: ABC transporter permease [Gemmatimonadaceae bacterium]|nr:ABC transporter permease [Gemmatimonadaceae bacterium]
MSGLLRDLQYAFRRLRTRIGFTLIAVISLGLGIGVNTAAFSLIDAIILRKTPIAHSERVAELDMIDHGQLSGPLSYADLKDLRDEGAGVFSQMSIEQFSMFPRDVGDHVESLTGELVNGDYFPLIGLEPTVGRLLGAEDDVTRGAHPVVVLGYNYWMSEFGGHRDVVGREMRLAGRAYTIVGVAPKAIEGLLPGLLPKVYVPIQMINELQPGTNDQLTARGNHSAFAKVRLANGQSFAAASAVVSRFVSDMQRLHPDHWPPNVTVRVIPLSKIAVSPLVDNIVVPAAAALMVVVGLVLIIACANLASFLLAQARDRRREIAVRLAIGATRRALMQQLLVESLVVALAGGALGIILSRLALHVLLTADLPIPLPLNFDVALDLPVLSFVIATTIAAGVLFGLLPALQATRPDVVETLKSENTGGNGKRRFTMRSGLVVAQTAASLVLLVTAALFLRSFAAQSKVEAGFGSAPGGLVWMALPADRYPAERRAQAVAEIERRVRALDDVSGAGVISDMLLNSLGNNSQRITVDGVQPPPGQTAFDIDQTTADSGVFDALGLTLVRGRGFNSSDTPARDRVAIVNQAMVDKFWPGSDAVGRTFRSDSAVYHIIGVVKTTKVRSLGEAPRPLIIAAFSQDAEPFFNVVVRARGDAALATTRVLTTLREIDPSFMIFQAKTMQQHLGTMLLPARLGAVAFALFAALALVLAMIGVYGVVRYAVARRSREVAIRLAIGARPDSVVRLLMRDGVMLVAIGAGVGLLVAAAAARALQALLFGVTAFDPAAFVVAPLLLLAVGALAAFLPARRASRIDPARAFRAE